jgi:phage FluMu protein Com
MEIRCGSCNKLFRVADEKITGSGIKFACTRCGEYVKITRDDFERYNLSKAASPAHATFEPTAPAATLETAQPEATGRESAPVVPVKGSEPPGPAAAEAPRAEPASPVTKPAPGPEPGHMIHPEPEAKPIPEAKPVAESKPEPLRPSTPSASRPERAPSPVRPATTAAEIIAAEPLARASSGKKYLILVLLLFVLGAAAFFILRTAGYNVFRFTRSASRETQVATKVMTSPEGLQITSASGSLDQNQDLIISGVIENTTDKEKAAWYVVVDVYDAQGTFLTRARMLNGKQLYTKKDYEVLAKRGVDVQELKTKGLQDPGVVIPPKGSVRFEIRFMEPPIGIASFNATLQPFDPEQLFKEIAEEQK